MPQPPILLFDGVCNLCNGLIQFILDHESDHSIRFAPLDSAAGKALLTRCRLPSIGMASLVFIEDGRCHTRSAGALRVAKHLRRPWKWMSILKIIPAPIRDWIYDRIAKNRYRWFGKSDQCRQPTPQLAPRFLGNGIA
ncbi:MAG: DCC1-like thiol-disulfide oxidoreductase family protein [Planctomycetota bacterium]|nr:DCC1-like thiol-disulfide oxidoreductase family protein [Planctomycetota bacterium]